MRIFPIIFLLLTLLTAFVRGQDNLHRTQIAAATANAVQVLKQDVLRVSLDRNLTVKDLIDKTGSDSDLTQTLQRAEQIGGPRWLDDNTCQVRLEIDGSRISQVLMKIATVAHERTPISAAALQPRLAEISSRTFT